MSGNSAKRGKIFLLAALEMEVKPLLEHFKKKSDSPKLYQAVSHETLWLVCSGVGGRRAESAAEFIAKEKPDFVIGLGYSGGLSPALKKGAFFIPREIGHISGEKIRCQFPFQTLESQSAGTLLSTDTIVQTPDEKAKLHRHADAVDMESFYAAKVFNRNQIPFCAIRIISDDAGESLPFDFSGLLDNEKAIVWGTLRMLLSKPHKLPALIKLGLSSKAISRRLSDFSLDLVAAIQKS